MPGTGTTRETGFIVPKNHHDFKNVPAVAQNNHNNKNRKYFVVVVVVVRSTTTMTTTKPFNLESTTKDSTESEEKHPTTSNQTIRNNTRTKSPKRPTMIERGWTTPSKVLIYSESTDNQTHVFSWTDSEVLDADGRIACKLLAAK